MSAMMARSSSSRAMAPTRRHHVSTVVVGAVIGLTWSAALRGWMVQLAGDDSRFTWTTIGLIMAPAAALGGLLAHAAAERAGGRTPRRALIWSPLLLAAALLDPQMLSLLIQDGLGGGALLIVITALAVGYLLTHWRRSVRTVVCGVAAAAGLGATAAFGTLAAPISTARGAWVCTLGLSLVLVVGLASTLPHRRVPHLRRRGHVLIGVVCGLAWAGGLRSFMAAVVGSESQVTWTNTVVWILGVGGLVGGLLGEAQHRRMIGRPKAGLVATPLLFAAVLLTGLLHPTTMFAGGVGGGALGVPLLGMAGAYAVAGAKTWARVVCGLVFLAGLIVWAVVATDVGGGAFSLASARGLWATALFYGLLVTLALSAAIPLRPVATGSAPRR